jgi:hypothetical protein
VKRIPPVRGAVSIARRRVGRKWIPPNYRLTPQALGSGKTGRYIESEYTQSANLNQVTLSSVLNNSPEYANLCTHYKYVKFIRFGITFYPQSTPIIIKVLNRYTDDTGSTNMDYNDSTKIIQTHTWRTRTVKFKFPNLMLLQSRASNFNIMNYKEWYVCDDLISGSNGYQIPGSILISKDVSDTSIKYRLTLFVIFKGADIPDATKLRKLADNIEKFKIYKEDKIEELMPNGYPQANSTELSEIIEKESEDEKG